MSILSLVLHDMHLPHALNQGVHHLGRSETSRRRPSIDVRLVYQVDVLGILAAAIARAPAHFNVIIAQWRTVPIGTRPQHAARPSTL